MRYQLQGVRDKAARAEARKNTEVLRHADELITGALSQQGIARARDWRGLFFAEIRKKRSGVDQGCGPHRMRRPSGDQDTGGLRTVAADRCVFWTCCLQIAEEPDVLSSLLQCRKPSARKVKQPSQLSAKPNRAIQYSHIAWRRRWIHYGMVHEQPRRNRTRAQQRNNHCGKMDQWNVQNVVEKWDAAKYLQYAATRPPAFSSKGNSNNMGPRVISRKSKEAGYLVVLRNEIHAGACGRLGGATGAVC